MIVVVCIRDVTDTSIRLEILLNYRGIHQPRIPVLSARESAMKTNELRQKYLEFFHGKGHQVCPSDVLVPKWDETVLFTPAGMNQFKDHFLGNVELEFTRATSCQKCLRTGDIDNVGRTAYHHTFFEMLGNFSFGDYFKRDAIYWAWEFLTDKKWLGIDGERLTVTVYLDDDEASEIWHRQIGLPESRITREDEKENFWPAEAPSQGPDGVCGPCSEIYYLGDDGKPVEIWNLVFTQFNRKGDPPENLFPLPTKNIDTGMGLERCAAVLQGVDTNYHIDILRPLVEAAGEVCSVDYQPESDAGRRLRRIADHVRACTFSIHENTGPGPKAENSVIRTLVRRAFLDGYQLGRRESFLYHLVPKVIELMKPAYPELEETVVRVQNTLKAEEDGFLNTVESGIGRVAPIIDRLKSANQSVFPGEEVFQLKTTFGIPYELVEKLALDNGLVIDEQGYHDWMEKHGTASSVGEVGVMGGGPLDQIKSEVKATAFLGYEKLEATATIKGLVEKGARTQSIETSENGSEAMSSVVVLDQSPFYGESGGQVGDTGTIESERGIFEVQDTQKDGDVIKHMGMMKSGTLSENDTIVAKVDDQRRQGIRRAHTATHIIHYALQKHISKDANQQGSKVEDDFLRFDYSNPQSVPDETLLAIEDTANERVQANEKIEASLVSLEEAKAAGAMMLFGEKYPDPCRMVSMGEFSRELCGGTHLTTTADVELLEIKSDSGLSAGTRRIEVFTGTKAKERREKIVEEAKLCAQHLQCSVTDLPGATRELFDYVKKLKKNLDSGKSEIPERAFMAKDTNQSMVETDFKEVRRLLRQTAIESNSELFDLGNRISNALQESERLIEQLKKLESAGGVSVDELIDRSEEVEGVRLITAEIPGGNPNLLRSTIDQIRKKASPVAVLLATAVGESKVLLVAGISKDLIDQGYSAGNWIKLVAPVVGGGGGGKPDMAQAGGKLPQKISDALSLAKSSLKQS